MAIYAFNKITNILEYKCSNKNVLDIILKQNKKDIKDYDLLQEFDMKYVSRITYIDGNCVYNNREYWTKTAVQNPLTPENYSEHEVLDFMGLPVTYDRYIDEFNNNINRLSVLDGVAGEVDYNITVGNEFISLFREECIFTDFQTVTPLEIAQKLLTVIALVQTGSFREAKMVLKTVEPDTFLTTERLKKYEDMLDAADAITYATAEDYFYTAADITEEQLEETYKRVTTSWSQSDWNSYRNTLASIGADDKYIMIIRHADRDSGDTGVTGDINETGLNSCKTVAEQMQDGTSWTKDGITYVIDCDANDAHYFSTNYTRTKHTAQALATYRLDTDSAASDFSGITDATETLVAERFLKEPKESGNSDLLSRWINDPSSLTQEELTVNIGVSTAEEATEKLTALAEQFTQEIIALADKRLNVFVTHDYYLVPFIAAMTEIKCAKDSKWLNFEAGLGIILHPDDTFEIFPIRCKGSGYLQ